MRRLLSLVLGVALCSACGGNTGTSPTTTTTPTRATATFTGTIGRGDSAFYSFTVATAGTTDVTLLSLHPSTSPAPALATPMALSIGTPAGTGCRASTTVTAQAALLPQLTTETTPTIYCVNITDAGALPITAAFTIRIVHP